MYGKGTCSVLGGCIALPNTGGSTILTIVAYTSIVVGGAILLSGFVRLMAKRAFTKA